MPTSVQLQNPSLASQTAGLKYRCPSFAVVVSIQKQFCLREESADNRTNNVIMYKKDPWETQQISL